MVEPYCAEITTDDIKVRNNVEITFLDSTFKLLNLFSIL